MPSIEISNDTFNRLKALAEPFVDKPEDVIRRLLNGAKPSAPTATEGNRDSGSDLVSSAGRVPHGTRLKANYRGQEYQAEVKNGGIEWNGSSYSSISAAAVAVIQSTGSKRPTENGWRFWNYYDESKREWRPLTELQH